MLWDLLWHVALTADAQRSCLNLSAQMILNAHYTSSRSSCKEDETVIHKQYNLNLAKFCKSSSLAYRNKHSVCILCALYGDLWCTVFWLSVFMKSLATWGSVATWTEVTLEACVWGLKNNGTLTWHAIMCWCLVARVFKTFLKVCVSCITLLKKRCFPSNLMLHR